jgi:hypothetical protein
MEVTEIESVVVTQSFLNIRPKLRLSLGWLQRMTGIGEQILPKEAECAVPLGKSSLARDQWLTPIIPATRDQEDHGPKLAQKKSL